MKIKKTHNYKSKKHTLNTRPYMSHLKGKIKRPVFPMNSKKYEDRELYNALLGFVYPAIFFPKRQCQITFRIKF